jgi:hypothetical protein
VDEWLDERRSGAKLCAISDRLFQYGFAGADVFAETAGWRRAGLPEERRI